jgi:hypothetical protein
MIHEGPTTVSHQRNADSPVRFRLANCSDAKALARLHYACSMEQPDGFMYKLGKRFLTQYYRILLRNRMSLVVCADAGTAGIVGLVSASVESQEEYKALQRGRLRLLLSALPALIRRPRLFGAVYDRANSLSSDQVRKDFVVGSGARLSFWGWSPAYPSRGQTTKLLQTAMRMLKALGVETVRLEIDRVNRKVEAIHRLMGGKVIEEFVTKDGRQRIVMEHRL